MNRRGWFMFSHEQLKAISGIMAGLGQVCIASAVVPFIVPSFMPNAMPTIVAGSLLAILFWTMSITSVKSIS